ncbi:MAG: competence/damage-inducible protein A [Bacteroidales bacterium]|jgi:nicotinamide-nucleotide amidase
MKAIIINIGDELLIGQVTNFNASWMAEQLNTIGVDVLRIVVISDKESEIIKALKDAEKNADIVLITGGLGPTNDDLTKETLCKYYNSRLVFDENTYKDIEGFFIQRGVPVTETNRKQAEVPENCVVIRNKQGTAPGLWFENMGKVVVATPGVPYEMKTMTADSIIPMIEKRMTDDTIVHKTVLTQGIGESFLADMITDWENNLPAHIKLAYLPSPGLVRLRLSARGNNRDGLKKEIEREVVKLQGIISDNIYGYDTETFEQIIGKLLTAKGKTLATAESCTGGYLAHCITKVPGSSLYYKGSVIAYSNEIKENVLDVSNQTLLKHGAVSEECVKEMAENIRKKFNVDYSVAVSGIAGPDGGTADKPVGLVWIAVSSVEETISQKFQFGNIRMVNIERASVTALNMLRKMLLK